ncbi:MAG: hypothetical protein AABX25_04350 [Nanoarchaeota archaeon]
MKILDYEDGLEAIVRRLSRVKKKPALLVLDGPSNEHVWEFQYNLFQYAKEFRYAKKIRNLTGEVVFDNTAEGYFPDPKERDFFIIRGIFPNDAKPRNVEEHYGRTSTRVYATPDPTISQVLEFSLGEKGYDFAVTSIPSPQPKVVHFLPK